MPQEDYPPVWECDRGVRVEVRKRKVQPGQAALPGEQGFEWIEIPTSSVELWVEKGDAAQVQRTAKVKFPTEWGENTGTVEHNSPRLLIDEFQPTDTQPFLFARIWLEDREGDWVLSHFGWIGGVGSSSTDGLSKLWVYDVAEMLSGVTIGTEFTRPTIEQAAEQIARLTNDNTPIPLSEVTLMAPETENEFAIALDNLQSGDLTPTGLDLSRFERAQPSVQGEHSPYFTLTDEGMESQPAPIGENYFANVIETDTGIIPVLDTGPKTFVANHDTLLDVYDWFEKKTDAKLHFEPMKDSVRLVADIEPSRRVFVANTVLGALRADRSRAPVEGEYTFHQVVDIRKNNALYEMKPKNTLRLRGSTKRGVLDPVLDTAERALEDLTLGAYDAPAEEYPVVTVQVPSLVQAAEGVVLAPPVVESDASTLDTAEAEAKRKMRKILEEPSEGEIIMDGVPRMMPFDALDAFEECEGDVAWEQRPVRYEIESVKHEKIAGESLRTRVKVSIWANDSQIETVKRTMVQTEAQA